MLYDLKDRIALVTGSSRGIGAAIAIELARFGARIVVHCGKEREQAEAVAGKIKAHKGEARVLQEDLANSSGPVRLLQAAFAAFGRLDILVNNAGVFLGSELGSLTEEQIDRVLQVNVRAVLLATREFAARTGSPCGRIINLSSIAGHVPAGGGSLYAASKAAVESLTRSHATELGPRGITVNAIAPGTIETEMVAAAFPPEAKAIISRNTPLGRFGRPEDVARVAAFLCTEAAGWVTGQIIGVDGGMPTGAFNLLRIARSLRAGKQLG